MARTLYIATPKKLIKTDQQPRLVEASSNAQTRLHVTKDIYDIRPAKPTEVAHLMNQGVKPEVAGEDHETKELPSEKE